MVQVVARPNTLRQATLINEDSQSLVFDDSNLFAWSKYSGYDRFEGGARANYGLQYNAFSDSGAYGGLMVGQSYHLAGVNSYASPDAANVGISSGLDSRVSDIVTRAHFSPGSMFNFIAKTRLDATTYNLRRLDLVAAYEEQYLNPWVAAERGYVDAVIDPADTRRELAAALEVLSTKRERIAPRRHDNLPL